MDGDIHENSLAKRTIVYVMIVFVTEIFVATPFSLFIQDEIAGLIVRII